MIEDTWKKVDRYLVTEKSLNGRVAALTTLKNSLHELTEKFKGKVTPLKGQPKPLLEQVKPLLEATKKVETYILQAKHLQRHLEGQVSNDIRNQINDYIHYKYFDISLESKVRKNAFRTVKDVSGKIETALASKIEGSQQLLSYITLQKDLENFLVTHREFLTDKQRSLIAELLPLLLKAAVIDEKIIQLWLLRWYKTPDAVLEGGIADIAYEIENAIDALKVGETFIFPGGYSSNPGHAIVYEVKRVREGEYHFSIFNTGLGAEFGQDSLQLDDIDSGVSNQSRVPVFTKLPREAVVDQKFLMDLLRFQIKDTPNKMDAVHQAILSQLKDKFSAELTTRELHDLQTWGTCSYDSIAAFLEYKLPPSLFVPFQYDMILRARSELNSLLPQGKSKHVFTDETLDFIDKKSCETIARWKKNFDSHCVLKHDDEDLMLSKIIYDLGIRNESDFKKKLQQLVDHGFLLSDELKILSDELKWSIGLKKLSPWFFWVHGPWLAMLVMKDQEEHTLVRLAGFAAAGSGFAAGIFLDRAPIVAIQEKDNVCIAERKVLNSFQNVIQKISPEKISILDGRRESIVPFCYENFGEKKNRANLVELDLGDVFDHFTTRYQEIALCASGLMNSTFSPLRAALQGCNMLPAPA